MNSSVPIPAPRSPGSMPVRFNRALDLLGRIAIAFLFIDAARYHLFEGWDRTLADMVARGVPIPQVLLVIAMGISIVLALALLFGIKARWAALGLAVYAMCVSVVMYNPFAHLGQPALTFFLKDLCIFGALLSLSRALQDTKRA